MSIDMERNNADAGDFNFDASMHSMAHSELDMMESGLDLTLNDESLGDSAGGGFNFNFSPSSPGRSTSFIQAPYTMTPPRLRTEQDDIPFSPDGQAVGGLTPARDFYANTLNISGIVNEKGNSDSDFGQIYDIESPPPSPLKAPIIAGVGDLELEESAYVPKKKKIKSDAEATQLKFGQKVEAEMREVRDLQVGQVKQLAKKKDGRKKKGKKAATLSVMLL